MFLPTHIPRTKKSCSDCQRRPVERCHRLFRKWSTATLHANGVCRPICFLLFRPFGILTVSVTPAVPDDFAGTVEVVFNEDDHDIDPMDVDREQREELERMQVDTDDEKAEQLEDVETPTMEDEAPEVSVTPDPESSGMYEEPRKPPPKTKRLDFAKNPLRFKLHSIVADILYHHKYNKSAGIDLLRTLVDDDLGSSALTPEAAEYIFRQRSDIDAYIKQTIPLSKTSAMFGIFYFPLGGVQ